MDLWYLILVLPAFLLAMIAQFNVKSTFNKYSKKGTMNGLTGAQAARAILDANGLQHIRLDHVQGELTDHYSHKEAVIRLSDSTFSNASIGAVGVAAHEAGHAVQYANDYGPIRVRTALIPVTNIGANLSWPAIILGIFLSMQSLITIGIILFSASVLFQLVTLPVEFDASNRAIKILDEYNMMGTEELQGAKKVLRAAAWTYIAALAVSIANLLRLILLFGGRRRR